MRDIKFVFVVKNMCKSVKRGNILTMSCATPLQKVLIIEGCGVINLTTLSTLAILNDISSYCQYLCLLKCCCEVQQHTKH